MIKPLFILTLATAPLYATILVNLPTPIDQGGMIHINVALKGTTLSAAPEAGTPVLQPLSAWKAGHSLDPASPWYATLDPAQAAGLFNSQFGFVLFESDTLPADSKIMIALVSGTPGLEVFRWRNTAPQLFDPILGTDGSAASWDWSTVSHGMMHPVLVLPGGSSGAASATFALTLTDSAGTPLAGYTAAQATVPFSVVPEPSVAILSMFGAVLTFGRRVTKRLQS